MNREQREAAERALAQRHFDETRWPWLRTRRVRRGLCLAVLAFGAVVILAGFLVEPSRNLYPIVMLGPLALTWLNIVLSMATRWIMNTRDAVLDEYYRRQQAQARAWAFKPIVLCLLVIMLGLSAATFDATFTVTWQMAMLSGFGTVILLACLPNIRLAWTLPDEE